MRYQNDGNAPLLALLPSSAVHVLDVGCGAGDNARALRAAGRRVWGVTISVEEAAAARAYCEDVWVGDVERMPLPEIRAPFDAMVVSHVLEHLAAPQATLARLAPLVKPGGWLLVAVPNMGFWRVRLRVLRGDWTREETGFFDRTHLQFWSYDTRDDILKGTPFEVVEARGADGGAPLRPLRWAAPRLASRIDHAVGALSPNLISAQVLILARRKA